MTSVFRHILGRQQRSPVWSDLAPVRDELFGPERLEHHARSLAAAQPVTTRPPAVLSLHARLNDNATVLLAAYRASAAELESGRSVVPAAEWLLDNYHLVEAQIREIRDDLPPGFYRQLPKLAEGPFIGYPRVFGLAWAFVAHTDSHFDPETLRRFINAYQQVQPLTIGELWAVAITLRIVLIENLRRLSDQISDGRATRATADALANRLLSAVSAKKALDDEIAARGSETMSVVFAAELAKRLRDQDPRTTPALGWLEEELGRQGSTIDEVVQHSQQRQGASNVSVRNVITSMRLISDIDWTELFENISLVDERLRGASAFATMDFPTRNLYRSAIEQLARGSTATELEVAGAALAAAAAAPSSDLAQDERVGDPGYHLIGEGRLALERSIAFSPPLGLRLSRFHIQLGIVGYVGSILLVTALLLSIGLQALTSAGVGAGWLALLAVVAFLPITDVATTLVNRLITWRFGAMTLPGLDLTAGVPQSLRTLVAVPTLLTNEADLLEQIERIEVHHLAGAGGDLTFALLTDGLDADEETLPGDARLLEVAVAAIASLNERYGPAPGGSRFLILHRRRQYNPSEGCWMGWERKRGKLHELNQLLRGATDTSYIPLAGCTQQVPADVRYVITLDADTRLPRDAAMRLIGKMAHPLNRPRFSVPEQRVVNGYAILQPRVTPSLPVGREGSFYQRVFSSPGGMDPYAAAVSDVYQDLFGEGSYTGKGIYDIDAFEAALAGRVPENTMLSHDLFEGVFARAGLATDVEVVEEFPSRYDVSGKRQHRWTRGDWQLLPWIFGARSGPQALPDIGRFKMLDNLRRSLVAPLTLLALALCWLLPLPAALIGTALILATMAIPALLPICFTLLPARSGICAQSHLRRLRDDLRLAASQTALNLAFLPDQAWRMLDAIARTLSRLSARRNLLEWTTAAQSAISPRLKLSGFYRGMAGGTLLGVGSTLFILVTAPASWPIVLPFALLWLGAPALALWASRSPRVARSQTLAEPDAQELRLIARRTWRFFETFVTPADNMLPPDNFQEDPKPVVARRTSPTNMGLYLLSAVTARDFGWAGTLQTIERLEATLESMSHLQLHRGHFFNWYATEDMRALEPAYVSAVDSGNLAGHLIAIANACEEWLDAPTAPNARAGLHDTLALIRQAIAALPTASGERGRPLCELLDEIATQLGEEQALDTLSATLHQLAEKATRLSLEICPPSAYDESADLRFWIDALGHTLAEHARDRQLHGEALNDTQARLRELARTTRQMALEMDFAFLLDPERKLLSIGYGLAENSLDPSCYDLLASEARLASLFAIAKGDVTTRHWFRLGRTATPLGNGSALISWSGSMFEYLMPSLVMRAPAGSLLEQTNSLVVQRQQGYGNDRNVPWGVSESAYHARDMEFTYQYSNFGVPGLGLKRGLAENLVIAPYATGLATMIDAPGAQANFRRLAQMGAVGRYGFYEALDFTPARLPDGQTFVIVRNYMAHHQGMTIVAIANTLQDGQMRARFHREPMIQACELLLQERMPRDVAIAHPRAEEVKIRAVEGGGDPQALRRLNACAAGAAPVTHLLSNGRYAVMLTAAGAGYSRWRDIAVTRWREDASRDDYGSFIFLRDTADGRVWPAGGQPIGSDALSHEVIFAEDRAEFIRHDLDLTTTLDVLVSGEDDGEVRRVSLVNSGSGVREIELTTYSEVVLTTPSTDNAHPAFAKLFVVTEYLPEFGALLATRRLRSEGERPIWAAHFAVAEGEVVADPQYETDRARFIGQRPSVATAAVIAEGRALSNTVGTVLDPIFALKYRVKVAPGKVARVAFWTFVAGSRDELLNLIEKHHDRSAYDRAKTLAWTQAQVQLRHLDIKPAEAADFQRLAAPILYADPHFRAPSAAIIEGAGAQSGLWPHSISGDLPIVLLRIDDIQDIAQVRQLLRAHEYWRMKRLAVDLVILNEHASSYLQDLQIAIETAVRSSQSRPRFGAELAHGSVYMLRADLLSTEARALLRSVARVSLIARRGAIANQLANQLHPSDAVAAHFDAPPSRQVVSAPSVFGRELAQSLEFFNGLGGFDKDGHEYVTLLEAGASTPAPWINVIANPKFGFQVSAQGSGYTWAENSRENQITPWSNDPVTDPCGEAFYINDVDSGALFSPTAQPIRDSGLYVARHGHGYSRFEHQADGIAMDLLEYVPLADPIKISRLTLRNLSAMPRRLSVSRYSEWVLGVSRSASAPFVITERDDSSGLLMARNPWSSAFPGRVSFADLAGRQTAWTADRCEFLGRNSGPATPAALHAGSPLSGRVGAGMDPCAALQCMVELAPGESVEIVAFLGQCASADEARALVERYRQADLDAVLQEVTDHWRRALGSVQVKTPDRAMDIMLNGWLLYQTLACRIWARSAFYQASGAYGFRDQLQDGMALTFSQPEATRSHILRAASRQFPEGDVQHWWLPHSGQGVRTRISDDRVWLSFATATYIQVSGDAAILDEPVTFLEGPLLKPGEHDAFFQPMMAGDTAPLFEHCARGLDQCLELTGEMGFPLIGGGDWNDGMNRVGEEGKGESVWLAWLLLRTIELFAPLADQRGTVADAQRAERWREHALALTDSLEEKAWDGEWYRRATFDDGTWLGSKDSDECRIDSIAQSWAVLSGAAEPARASQAMASVKHHLIREHDGLALLFTPPFDKTEKEPGYIKGYPPGLRENGGQYSHAAMWAMLAFAKLGDGDAACRMFKLLNPINHSLTPEQSKRYKVEPYVVAADVYGVAPHNGRGGWTWYTGAAGWMYRAGVEGILGIRREGNWLFIDPCISSEWPVFEANITLGETRYAIRVENPAQANRGIKHARLNDNTLECDDECVRLALDGGQHRLLLTL
ncbi:glycosyl transferase [Stutzerimonas stutzeri]|uniref:Glycosyl transferase n=1 Tax=Stutzerimonas stutzeri TaxID=316 RepID=A0A2S4AM65_STUST|nr:glucoamylase family protein [Stutzerimonas stutzeri]MCQ4262116.1 glycosyl transferase [Stutzerimonas stutzeri]POH82550.1 glycosyl transferase [Stutzerimonas stutzeri]